ncbi:hypothetical protein C8Q76DRAFT_666190 [Earliella scabrosa]|nr:hypothetical protein C8Q76DRAFT_666190 [Earliella scabrosa]
MLPAALVTLSIAATAYALPATTFADGVTPGPWCDRLGPAAFDNLSGFVFTARDKADPTANPGGVPLFLTDAGVDAAGARLSFLSVGDASSENKFPTFAISEGRIIPSGPDQAPTVNIELADGDEMQFVTGDAVDPATAPGQQYCAVAPTGKGGGVAHTHLAANGDVDSWHLCENGGRTNVVFRPAEGRAYDLASCKPIVLQLIY